MDEVRHTMNAFIHEEQELLKKRERDNQETKTSIWYWFYVITTFLMIAILIFAYYLRKEIIKPLNDMTGQIDGTVAGQNFNLQLNTRNKEIIQLKNAFNRLFDVIKENNKLIKKTEIKYRTVADNTYDWETWIDNDGQWLYSSPASERLTGYKSDEFIKNKHFLYEIIHQDDKEKANEYFKYVHEEKIDLVFRIYHKSGETRWIECLSNTVYTEEGNNIGQRVSIRDITQRIQNEKLIVEAKNTAEKALNVKSIFLANMSHEIRTPMNGIIGMMQLALQTDLTDKQKNYIQKAHLSAEHLLAIINDILDFSKIEADKMKIESVNFYLQDIIRNVLNPLQPMATENNISLHIKFQPNVPKALNGDPLRLSQVLINLLNNAIKFSNSAWTAVRKSLTNPGIR